jgi:DNA repair protein RecO (recombination protein O)
VPCSVHPQIVRRPGLADLTEAKLECRFRARELSRLYAGYYVAELLGELTDDYDPHPALFDSAELTLRALEGDAPLASLVLRFELTALAWLGHLPSWSACAECGRPVEAAGRMAFGQLAGGVLCSACRPGKSQVVSVSAGVVRALERYADLESDVWKRTVLDERTAGELRGVLNHYLSTVIGHRPRMHRYLGTLAE